MTFTRGNGGPSNVVVMGPRPGNVARGIYRVLYMIMKSFLCGILVSASLFPQGIG